MTCDCDLERKSIALDRAAKAQQIDYWIMTRQCGGDGPMREILDALVAQWPSNATPKDAPKAKRKR